MKTTSQPTLQALRLGIVLVGLCISGSVYAALVAVWGDTNASTVPLPPGLTNVKAFEGGGAFSLALKTDGTVVAWGKSDPRNTNALTVPAGLSNVTAIAAGDNHALALTSAGRVVAWGYGIFGETNVPADLSKVTAIAAGGAHSLALKSDGTVVAWGSGFGGATNVPDGLTEVKAIAAASGYSLALKHDGTVAAWGSHAPVPEGLSNVSAIAAGDFVSLALKADGRVVAWGGNEYGQTNMPPDLNEVTAIAAGYARAVALKADGRVVVWGRILVEPAVPSALTNALAIAAGGNHNLALVFSGPVRITQHPQSRSAAVGSSVSFGVGATGFEPIGYRWFFNGTPLDQAPSRAAGVAGPALTITNVQIADTGLYSVLVRNALGNMVSSAAELTVGIPPIITSQTPNQTVGAGASVTLSVSAQGTPPLSYQWALHGTNLPGKTFSSLYIPNAQPEASGSYTVTISNAYGTASAIIGLTVTNRPPIITQQPFLTTTNLRTTLTSPVLVGSTVVLNVSAIGSLPLRYQWRCNGADLPGATNTTLALSQLSPAQSGFYNVEIRNAFGTTNSAKLLLNVSQVAVAGAPMAGGTNMPLGLGDVTALAGGGSHVMALKTDGTVRTWLANPGFIFDYPAVYTVTNVPATVTNIVAIAAGRDHCLALRSNGTVVAWGGSYSGQTNVSAGLSNVVSIAAGWSRSYAVKADGTVTGWGTYAQVPAGLSNVVSVATGPSHNLALRRNGTVAFWTGTGPITMVPGLSNAIAVAASSSANRALRADGTVVNWPAMTASTPSLVLQGNLPVSNAVAIALGSGNTSLILKQDGTIIASGFPQGAITTTNNLKAIAAGGVQTGFGVLLQGTGAPFFTLHPVGQTVQKSNTVSFHARSVGWPLTAPKPPMPSPPVPPPVRFQWQRDGTDIPGATNVSLTLSNVLGRDTGDYRLVATNALGAATSRVATLSIPFSTNLAAALNTTNLQWITDRAPTNWFAQNRETHDGDIAAQSARIGHNQTSTLLVSVPSAGTLRFWWKVSSEAGFDFLRVYVNASTTPAISMSGETDWEQRSLTLPGSARVRWVYSKDGSVNAGRDAAWLDEVTFTPSPPTVTISPATQTVSAGANASFFAVTLSESKPVFYQWRFNGTNLPGATNQTLLLSRVGREDRGNYAALVTNAGGSTLASNATLYVLAPQRMRDLRRLADGSVELLSRDSDGGAPGLSDLPGFEAHASTNLVNWETLPGALSLTNGSLLLRDTNAVNHSRRFYRIVEH